MERILVISYRFPPADETGTQRTWALAKYLKEFGYYPVFVTRNWSHPLNTLEDMNVPAGTHIEHEKHEDYEVYILPHKRTLKLKINTIFRTRLSFVRNIFNMLDYVFMYFGFLWLNEFSAFKRQSEKIIAQDPSIKKAIIITDPFPLFQIGHHLNKKYGTKWIADYRDDWNTREVNDTYDFRPNIFHKIANFVTTLSEKKWVGSSSYITSVSEEYSNRISKFTGVKGVTIYNGYFEEAYSDFLFNSNRKIPSKNSEKFTIVHNGTLYPTQKIEIFLNGFKNAVNFFQDRIKLKIKFIGISYKKGATERIDEIMKDYKSNYICTSRVNRVELFTEISDAQLALMVSHGKQFKGITSSKIFDYIGLSKRVLCCPPDNDIVEQILTDTGLGDFCETELDVYNYLINTVENYLQSGLTPVSVNPEAATIYTRKKQTMKVADLLNKL